MRFKLGDFVRFVDERREGYITRIFDEEMIGVTGDDDFEIPVLASKVTTVHGHQSSGIASEAFEEKRTPVAEFVTKGVYLAVTSDQRIASVVHFHLVNETSFQLLLSLTTERQNQFKGEYAGIIAPKTAVKIYSAPLPDIQIWPKFHFQALYYTSQNIAITEPLVYKENFKAKDFSGGKKSVNLLKEPAWLIRLDEPEMMIDAQKLKESFFKPAEEKREIEKPASEVDLHIEKLHDDHRFLGSDEILRIQLDTFKKALDAAIVHKLPAITFIHGVGNGTLKNELHKLAGRHPHVQTFMDARKEKFGYGATKLLLK
ncbi:DNA mismatch repair protein MutS [Mucilaginibacter sp. PPCGB 2223]|uniref:Smr/MutS family protein n=1 Tax=Mucilaginibacter sp. PPCGB 2223 TaxID=1886027 RepID=UPI00082667BF|nr:Smr/MutS family protein [Mucilaginibacter sp. PPCGB 2223]OCX50632.1 DNA mismatch repair protein MutS [Mucilaginibacter sp. PPCGB 2223]